MIFLLQKPLNFIVIVSVILTTALLHVSAQDTDFIKIGKSDWTGSVFGDVGGADKITIENFEITQPKDGTYVLRSSYSRGKIASTSEGIAYLYKRIPLDRDFEMTVTAEVMSFDMNNQVSFGIMLRDTVYKNESLKENLGSYLAVGPVDITKEPAMFVFYRTPSETTVKTGDIKFNPKPVAGTKFEISLEKSGNDYILIYGNEEPLKLKSFNIFNGKDLFIGLFTSRNTKVTFTNLSLDIK